MERDVVGEPAALVLVRARVMRVVWSEDCEATFRELKGWFVL